MTSQFADMTSSSIEKKIEKTHVLVLPNIWRLGRVRDIKIVSNEILLNAAKCQMPVPAFTISELLRENQHV